MPNKFFYCGLTLSFIAHVSTITYFSVAQAIAPPPKLPKQIEVVYQDVKVREVKALQPKPKSLKMVKDMRPVDDLDILSKKPDSALGFQKDIKDISKFKSGVRLERKESPRIDAFESGRKISVPLFESEKITNPRYLSYNQHIRQKIRQRAYAYIEHPDFQAGEVYLTFVVQSNGRLSAIKILDDRTRANSYLKEIGLRSVKDSAPFPPFPKELNYPELTFNVIISFEVGP